MQAIFNAKSPFPNREPLKAYVILMTEMYYDKKQAKAELEMQIERRRLDYNLQGSPQFQFDPKEGKWFAFQAMVNRDW